MPRTKEKNQEILDKRKEEILNAALEEFCLKGYSGTKISDIVKRAGISQGLIYHYYKSKDELYFDVVDKSMSSANELINMVKMYNLKGWSAICAVVKGLIEWLNNGGEGKLRFIFMNQVPLLNPMPKEVQEALKGSLRINEWTAENIKEAQKEGIVIHGNPNELAAIFWAMIQGVITNNVLMERMGLEELNTIPEEEMLLKILKK